MVTAPTATTPAVNGALIRKGIALAVHPDGIRFGEWLVRELRGLIKAVAEDKDHTILNPIQARLKRACKLHRDHETEKIRALAREILNDCRRLRHQPCPAANQQRGPCAWPSSSAASASEREPRKVAPPTPPPCPSSGLQATPQAINLPKAPRRSLVIHRRHSRPRQNGPASPPGSCRSLNAREVNGCLRLGGMGVCFGLAEDHEVE